MGFGYLLLGYLVSFVIYNTLSGLGFGGAALLVGYALMLYGLWMLNRYQKAFVYAKWLLIPALLTAAYETLRGLAELFLWDVAFLRGSVSELVGWVTFLLLIAFNLAMLYGIRTISTELELKHMAVSAVRNSFFVALYALLYLIAKLPIEAVQSVKDYFTLPLVLTNLIWVVCNLLLLLACNKNICRAGDEDQPAKPSRFALINRIGNAYEKNRQRAIETTTREAEEVLRRRKEKREQKNKKKKNKR